MELFFRACQSRNPAFSTFPSYNERRITTYPINRTFIMQTIELRTVLCGLKRLHCIPFLNIRCVYEYQLWHRQHKTSILMPFIVIHLLEISMCINYKNDFRNSTAILKPPPNPFENRFHFVITNISIYLILFNPKITVLYSVRRTRDKL